MSIGIILAHKALLLLSGLHHPHPVIISSALSSRPTLLYRLLNMLFLPIKHFFRTTFPLQFFRLVNFECFGGAFEVGYFLVSQGHRFFTDVI